MKIPALRIDLSDDLAERFGASCKKVRVRSSADDRTRDVQKSMVVRKLLERWIEDVEAGRCVVDAKCYQRVSAVQLTENGRHVAPLETAELYVKATTLYDLGNGLDRRAYTRDARHVQPGARVYMRGVRFTRSATMNMAPEDARDGVELVTENHLRSWGALKWTVTKVRQKRAVIELDGKKLLIHAFDLMPARNEPGTGE